eukprot:gene25136-32793_t
MKKRVAYVDCFSGIAGDMFLAALLNCGLNKSELTDHLRSIRHINNEWELTTTETLKSDGNISALMVNIKSVHGEVPLLAPSTAEEQKIHNQSHNHSHGHSHVHESHDHDHGHDHDHKNRPIEPQDHSHGHDHAHDGGNGHLERNLFTIMDYILASNLSNRVKCMSVCAFTELAIAEARVHGTTPQFVHFHEVGAVMKYFLRQSPEIP